MAQEDENLVKIRYVGSRNNLADLMTKGVDKGTLRFLAPFICGHKPIRELMLLIIEEAEEALK